MRIRSTSATQPQVARLFERVGTLSHLVVTAADLPYGPVVSLSEEHGTGGPVQDPRVWDRLATPDVKNARMADLAARLPARRLGRPEDIANAVAFLIADNFVTGTVPHAEGAQVLV